MITEKTELVGKECSSLKKIQLLEKTRWIFFFFFWHKSDQWLKKHGVSMFTQTQQRVRVVLP
jgi:hypothetical protein